MPDRSALRIAVIGTGYVGLVSGVCLASTGLRVTCVDRDAAKIATLRAAIPTIYEPGLEPIMKEAAAQGLLEFTADAAQAIPDADAVILAVGTPTDPRTGTADLSYLAAAATEIAPLLKRGAIVIVKSTVPPGSNRRVREIILGTAPDAFFRSVSNPEFLREGRAVRDFLDPDRIIIGTDDPEAETFMKAVYAPFADRLFATSIEAAEIAKYAANAFLATKIAFINEIADLCERTGADVRDVAHGMGLDQRIAPAFLNPGPGYGGSCFPKDTLALIHCGRAHGAPQTIVEAAAAANTRRKEELAFRVAEMLGDLRDARITLLGLAFKAGTDDVRDSPAIDLIHALKAMGASIAAHDPQAAHHQAFDLVERTESVEAAADGADALVIVTEWPDYAGLSLDALKARMRGHVIVDFRNLLDPAAASAAGFIYRGIGRGDAQPLPAPHALRIHAR